MRMTIAIHASPSSAGLEINRLQVPYRVERILVKHGRHQVIGLKLRELTEPFVSPQLQATLYVRRRITDAEHSRFKLFRQPKPCASESAAGIYNLLSPARLAGVRHI